MLRAKVDDMDRLDLTKKDIELIEAALHTQSKILAVQSEAGGCGAQKRLGELKHLIKRIGRAQASQTSTPPVSLTQMAMNLLHPQGSAAPYN